MSGPGVTAKLKLEKHDFKMGVHEAVEEFRALDKWTFSGIRAELKKVSSDVLGIKSATQGIFALGAVGAVGAGFHVLGEAASEAKSILVELYDVGRDAAKMIDMLDINLKRQGLSWKENGDEVEEWAGRFGRAHQIAKESVLGILNAQLARKVPLEDAQARALLVASVAAKTGKDVNEAGALVARVAMGGRAAMGAMRMLGMQAANTGDAVRDVRTNMANVVAFAGDAHDRMLKRNPITGLMAAVDDAKHEFGEEVYKAFQQPLIDLGDAIRGISPETMKEYAKEFGEFCKDAAAMARDLLGVLGEIKEVGGALGGALKGVWNATEVAAQQVAKGGVYAYKGLAHVIGDKASEDDANHAIGSINESINVHVGEMRDGANSFVKNEMALARRGPTDGAKTFENSVAKGRAVRESAAAAAKSDVARDPTAISESEQTRLSAKERAERQKENEKKATKVKDAMNREMKKQQAEDQRLRASFAKDSAMKTKRAVAAPVRHGARKPAVQKTIVQSDVTLHASDRFHLAQA